MAAAGGITINVTPKIDEAAVREVVRDMVPVILDELKHALVEYALDSFDHHFRRIHRLFDARA